MFILLIVFGPAGLLPGQTRALSIEEKTEISGKKLAVLIGINDYEHLRKLECAKNDVILLRDSLYKIGFEKENVFCLTCDGKNVQSPQLDNIIKTIENALSKTREGDLLFVAMSGHGLQLEKRQLDESRLDEKERNDPNNLQPRFCPIDADNSSVEKLLATTISIKKIYEDVIRCQATYKLMLIDACRNAPTERKDHNRNAFDIRAKSIDVLPTPPKGIVLLQSCGEGEMSYEDPEFKHGIFSYYIAEGISGKAASPSEGLVTLLRLASYASRNTTQRVRYLRRLGKIREAKEQTPFLTGETADILIAEVPIMSASFPNDFHDLHEAVKRLGEGGILTIGPGTHKISKPLVIDKNIQIVGSTGDPNDVILLSSGKGVLKATAEKARLQGLTLHVKAEQEKQKDDYSAACVNAGKSSFVKCHFTSDSGSGILVIDEADPSVQNCVFRDGKANGIKVMFKGKGVFEKCETSNNEWQGIAVLWEGNPVFRNCIVRRGKMNGILVKENGKGIFENCDVYENTAFGINVATESEPTVRECKFYSGKGGGIFVNEKGKGTFEKCEIYENQETGIRIRDESAPIFRNCNIHDGKAGGISVYQKGKGFFEKCEIYGNAEAGISIFMEGNPTVNECVFRNGKAETAEIVVFDKGKGTFERCEIYENASPGIAILTEGDPIVRDCKFYNGKSVGIFIFQKGKGTFEKCDVNENQKHGIEISDESAPIFRNCNIRDGKVSGICVYKKGKGSFEKCSIYGNHGPGITIATKGAPTLKNCKFYGGKQGCVYIYEKGEGFFYDNVLSDPKNDIWDIRDSAGPVVRQGNKPNEKPPIRTPASSSTQRPGVSSSDARKPKKESTVFSIPASEAGKFLNDVVLKNPSRYTLVFVSSQDSMPNILITVNSKTEEFEIRNSYYPEKVLASTPNPHNIIANYKMDRLIVTDKGE